MSISPHNHNLTVYNPNLTMHKIPRLEPLPPPPKLPPMRPETTPSIQQPQIAALPSRGIRMAQGVWRGASKAATIGFDIATKAADLGTNIAYKGADLMNRNIVTREIGLVGVSALVAYVGTYVFGELPWTASTFGYKVLTGEAQWNDLRNNWINLNAHKVAIFGALTVPVFQISNRLFQPATYPEDGKKKDSYFSIQDAKRMAQGSLLTLVSIKIGEIIFSIPGYIAHVFAKGNPSHPFLAAGFGIGSAVLLDDGVSGLNAPEKSRRKFIAKIEVALGTAGVGYTIFKTFYNYMKSTESFQWSTHSAVGMASRGAIGVPVSLLLGQFATLIPKTNNVALKIFTRFALITTNIVVASAIGHQLGFPGVNLEDPRNTFLSIAYSQALFYGMQMIPYVIQKGLPAIMDMIFPQDASIAKADEAAFRQKLLLFPQKDLVVNTIAHSLPVR